MKLVLVVGAFILLLVESSTHNLLSLDPDAELPVPNLIKKYNFPCETHYVTTEDGYILTLHRIPPIKKANGKVIFLQHGILSSSADWIMLGTEKGLAYLLSEEGYDVWMGNNRGNHYGRNHTTLNPDKDAAFWDFSFHEVGTIDIPAMVDYTLAVTNKTKLFYVGHSQGTTAFLVAGHARPEALAKLFGMNEFFPNSDMMARFGDLLCKDGDICQVLCENALFVLCGFSPKEMNATLFPVLMGHTPSGASRRELMHFGQEINSGHFRQYDLGLFGNMKKYGRVTPPEYNLKKVTSQIHLFYSHNDWLSALKDVNRLAQKLPNLRAKIIVDDGNFNHLDYLFGIRAKELVYNKIISLLTHYK